MKELTTTPELQGWLPRLTTSEMARLRENILEDGCRDAIVVWANHDNTIIDGHHRYEICLENGIPYKTKALQFDSIEDVKIWVLNNQDGRRNLTKAARDYRMGKAYLETKLDPKDNLKKGTDSPSGQNVHSAKTADQLAEQFGVNEKTIRRAAKEAERLDALPAKERLQILTEGEKPLSKDEKMSRQEQMLAAVKKPGCTKETLQGIAYKFSGPLGVLRREHRIELDKETGFYVYKGAANNNGAPVKTKTKDGYTITIKSRFDLPDNQEDAIKRVGEIVKYCKKKFKGTTSYTVNYQAFIKSINEMDELMKVFRVAK